MYNIGDCVYFEEKWSRIIWEGTVINVSNDINGVILDIHCKNGTLSMYEDKCFSTYSECNKYIQDRDNQRVLKIKAQINSVEDLVSFMYDNVVCLAEEYTDYTARRAVKEIAKEMLNIDLE